MKTAAQADKLKKEARVYVWGNAEWGALASPNLMEPRSSRCHPLPEMWRPILAKLGETHNLKAAAAGYGFSLFLTDNKEYPVWGSGNNKSGQLGEQRRRGVKGGRSKPLEILLEAGHIQLPLKPGEKVVGLAAGRAHSLILTSHNEVLSLGDNAHGQCGRPIVDREDPAAPRPVHRLDVEGVAGVVAGQDHSFFLTLNGSLFSCGWAADGQTGQGHYKSSGDPMLIRGDLEGEEVVKVTCAADCALALNSRGEVFGWGNSEYGQFSMVTEDQQLHTPTHLHLGLGEEKVVDIASGGTTCTILTQSGRVFTWGFGLLGLGPNVTSAKTPQEIPQVLFGRNAFSPESTVASLAAGLGHQAALTNDGCLYSWGKNRSCCLGLGSKNDQPFPLKVALGGKVVGVSLGVDHSMAVVKSWMSK